jgi:hypothetical protein
MLRLVLVTSISAAVLCGCNGTLPKAPSKTDQRTVYVWPMDTCPSLIGGAAGAPHALGTVLLSTLLGNLVSGLVGIPAAALSAAADADNQGLKATGTNARYYYTLQTNAVTKTVDLIPPACYVVAYSKPVAAGTHWCDDPVFAASVPKTCQVGRSPLGLLKVREELGGVAQPGIAGLSVPEIYFEIGFDSAGYEQVVRPRIIAMHYPKSIIQPGSSEARAITLQIDITSPLATDPMKAAQVVMVIPNVAPAAPVDPASTANVITGWTTIPVTKGPTEVPDPKGTKPFLPVTMKATLNEVGDPHAFLQAFAKAFGASAGDYSKAITNELSPIGQATAQQAQDKNTADYTTALAAAQKSRGELLAICAPTATPPATAQAKAAADSQLTTVQANQMKANLGADLAGVKPRPFPAATTVEGFTKCW